MPSRIPGPMPPPAMTATENSFINVSTIGSNVVLARPHTPYGIENVEALLTPALAIYPEIVDQNIANTLRLLGGDANRCGPHVKTAKLGVIIRRRPRRAIV